MKKKFIALLLTGAMLTTTACSRDAKNVNSQKEPDNTAAKDIQPEATPSQEDTSAEDTANTETNQSIYNEITGEAYHTRIKKSGDLIFYIADQGIYSVNPTTGQTNTIYIAPKGNEVESFCINNGMIYFVEAEFNDIYGTCKLYSTNVEGADPVLAVDGLEYSTDVSVYNNIIYLGAYDTHSCYAINEDGAVGRKLSDGETYYSMLSGLKSGEDGYNELMSVGDSLNRYQKIWTVDGEGSLWCFSPEDGTSKEYKLADQIVVAVSEPYVISWKYEEDESQFYLYNTDTMQNTEWFKGQEVFLDADENGAYFEVPSEETLEKKEYEYITWDGTKTTLFEIEIIPGMSGETRAGAIHFSVIDGTIYYQYGEGDKMYLMERKLDETSRVTKLGDAYLDKGYAQYGHVEREAKTEYCSKDDTRPLVEVAFEQFVFDGDSDAVKKMNAMLSEIKEATLKNSIRQAKDDEEWIASEEDISPYSYTSEVQGITVLSDRYVQIEQRDYEFTGGAHGMPIRYYYLMDTETGERLLLNQVVSNTEEEIKSIAAQYFQKMKEAAPDIYWDNAVDLVKENAGYNDMFYLTNDGIVFYFPPYDLAAYSYGFIEVEVPYSEFDLKLSLQD